MSLSSTQTQSAFRGRLRAIWRYRRLWSADLFGVSLLALVTVILFWSTNLDLDAARLFFHPDRTPHWFYDGSLLWGALNRYGMLPALLVTLGAFVVLLAGRSRPHLKRLRVYAFFIITTMAVGPGITVNLVLKEYSGRPRPKQCRTFGGYLNYRQHLDFGVSGRGKSFPCGHSSTGFFFCVFYFIYRRRSRLLRWLALLFSIALGLLIGAARMRAGAHFFSDVLWSGYLVFLPALALYYFLFNIPAREDAPDVERALGGGRVVVLASTFLTIAALVGGLTAIPYYKEIRHFSSSITDLQKPVNIQLDMGNAVVDLETWDGNHLAIEGEARAFRILRSQIRSSLQQHLEADPPSLRFFLRKEGWFIESDISIRIRVPERGAGKIDLTLRNGYLYLDPHSVPPANLDVHLRGEKLDVPKSWRPYIRLMQDEPGVWHYRINGPSGNDT